MRFVKVILFLAFFVFSMLFFVQNTAELGKELTLQLNLHIEGLNWKSEPIPYDFVLLCAFAAGVLLSSLSLLIDRIRLGCLLMGRNRALRTMEKEMDRMRNELAKETKAVAKSTEVKELPQESAAEAKTK